MWNGEGCGMGQGMVGYRAEWKTPWMREKLKLIIGRMTYPSTTQDIPVQREMGPVHTADFPRVFAKVVVPLLASITTDVFVAVNVFYYRKGTFRCMVHRIQTNTLSLLKPSLGAVDGKMNASGRQQGIPIYNHDIQTPPFVRT